MEFTKMLNAVRNALADKFRAVLASDYHRWYYDTGVWRSTRWMGAIAQKSVSDMWNYQEILASLRPSLIIEFGTGYGGSALFFAAVMRQIGKPFRILSVDINGTNIHDAAKNDADIALMQASSSDPSVAERVKELKAEYPGQIFAILDSDHRKEHVLAEMLLLRPLLAPGDYLIVEDSNINGHPVLPSWGDGPFEAIQEYTRRFSDDYRWDKERELKFGFTFAPRGFLVRR
jgi:cephalosporin hydroxylase